jgi:hypothetical protein
MLQRFPQTVLQTKPATRCDLSLTRHDRPSLNCHDDVNAPDLHLRNSAEAVFRCPFGFELPSSLAGRINVRSPLHGSDLNDPKLLLNFRSPSGLPAVRITAPVQVHSRGLPLSGCPISVRSPTALSVKIAAGSSFPVRYVPPGSPRMWHPRLLTDEASCLTAIFHSPTATVPLETTAARSMLLTCPQTAPLSLRSETSRFVTGGSMNQISRTANR